MALLIGACDACHLRQISHDQNDRPPKAAFNTITSSRAFVVSQKLPRCRLGMEEIRGPGRPAREIASRLIIKNFGVPRRAS